MGKNRDDLVATTWLGEVVDIEDPQKIGRIKVKVYGKFDELPTEDIPWAYPGNNQTGGSKSGGGFFSVPKLGSIVSVKFDAGNIYHPEYFFVQKISDEVKEEISGSYPNAHVIVYDTITEGSLKIFFTEKKGLMLDYKGTQINIKPDKNIDITTTTDINVKCNNMIVDQATSIELGKGAQELAILGNSFLTLFNSHTHIGNLGAPTSPPTLPMTPVQHLSGKGAIPSVKLK
jgi:hypothetical protein